MIKPVLQGDPFVRDVVSEDGSGFRLWWVGQSGFLLRTRGRFVLFDPYLSDSLTRKYANSDRPHVRMSERVCAPEQLRFVHVVTSSHAHTDHLDADTLIPLLAPGMGLEDREQGEPLLIVPEANRAFAAERLGLDPTTFLGLDAYQRTRRDSLEIYAVPAAHPTIERDAEGRMKCLGYVVQFEDGTVYHSGDSMAYDEMVESLRRFAIDVALLPINGKLGNMNGAEAAKLAKDIRAKLVIPCHYDMFEFNTADPYEQFVPECERIGQPYRVLKLGERLTLDPK